MVGLSESIRQTEAKPQEKRSSQACSRRSPKPSPRCPRRANCRGVRDRRRQLRRRSVCRPPVLCFGWLRDPLNIFRSVTNETDIERGGLLGNKRRREPGLHFAWTRRLGHHGEGTTVLAETCRFPWLQYVVGQTTQQPRSQTAYWYQLSCHRVTLLQGCESIRERNSLASGRRHGQVRGNGWSSRP